MNKKELLLTANEVRKGIIVGTFHAKSGHPGGSLSATECIVYLYFNVMNIDPKDPEKPDRDRFVLSKGHAAPALYAVLAERGYFPKEELETLRQSEWHFLRRSAMSRTEHTHFSATVNLKRDRYGKPPCSRAIASLTICA